MTADVSARTAKVQHAGMALTSLFGLLLAVSTLPHARANEPSAALQCSRDLGPQAPRDLAVILPGSNAATPPAKAPAASALNLCNIHFHKYAEHKAPGFKTPFGTGTNAGFVCDGKPAPKAGPASAAKSKESKEEMSCQTVAENDTIEVHWVFTSCPAPATPYLPGLANCTRCPNPALRVEAKVFHVAGDGVDFASYDLKPGTAQPVSLPGSAGAIEYQGSTTGNSYNNESNCSPASVTWNVRPECASLKLASLKSWCAKNAYAENVVHGVRPLVNKPDLLSPIK